MPTTPAEPFVLDDIGPRGMVVVGEAGHGHSHAVNHVFGNNIIVLTCLPDLPEITVIDDTPKKHNKGRGRHKVKSWERDPFRNYKA